MGTGRDGTRSGKYLVLLVTWRFLSRGPGLLAGVPGNLVPCPSLARKPGENNSLFLTRKPEGKKARRFSFLERKPGENNSLFLTRKPEGKKARRFSFLERKPGENNSVFFNEKTPEGKKARRFSFLERKPGENNSVFFNEKTPEGKKARRFSFLERKPGENNSLFLTRKPEGENLPRLPVSFYRGNLRVLVMLVATLGGSDVSCDVGW
jgi:hypothetical protein